MTITVFLVLTIALQTRSCNTLRCVLRGHPTGRGFRDGEFGRRLFFSTKVKPCDLLADKSDRSKVKVATRLFVKG